MDTIETSNLNRQFLFRKSHVGESKASVAAQAVQKFRPKASIKAHQVMLCKIDMNQLCQPRRQQDRCGHLLAAMSFKSSQVSLEPTKNV